MPELRPSYRLDVPVLAAGAFPMMERSYLEATADALYALDSGIFQPNGSPIGLAISHAAKGLPPRDTERTMSQENVEAFRRAQEAYNQGDWDAALALIDPNVVLDSTRAGPDGEIYRGHEGVKRFWRMLREVFGSSLRNEPGEIIDNGDRLFTRIRQRSTGRASGAMTEDVIYQIITIDEGKAIRMEFFRDRAEALEAAGLSEQDAHTDS